MVPTGPLLLESSVCRTRATKAHIISGLYESICLDEEWDNCPDILTRPQRNMTSIMKSSRHEPMDTIIEPVIAVPVMSNDHALILVTLADGAFSAGMSHITDQTALSSATC
jgi:hypothetical protein